MNYKLVLLGAGIGGVIGLMKDEPLKYALWGGGVGFAATVALPVIRRKVPMITMDSAAPSVESRTSEKLKTTTRKVSDLIEAGEEPPLPLEVIPNSMGINLSEVDSMTWTKQKKDGQLVDLTIHFNPYNP